MSCGWCLGRPLNDHDCSNFEGLYPRIDVVDGVDGLTPDMLRQRKVAGVPVVYDEDCPPGVIYALNEKYMFPPRQYFGDQPKGE